MPTSSRPWAGASSPNFSSIIARATVENSNQRFDGKAIKALICKTPDAHDFIERTFAGVFFTLEDLRFLDRISGNIRQLENPYHQALAFSALFRSCLKRQPRGVFTVSGDLSHYDVFSTRKIELVYLDPPYVPRADDNCIKRYHFLGGHAIKRAG